MEQPPFDTGEAMDLGPHSLTITVGFGPSLFDDRFGLAGRQPAALAPFGTIPGDAVMRPALSDGDLCIQACADDPQVVFHAVRNMVRAARGTAVLQVVAARLRPRVGHRCRARPTPRNLMGFKDGTRNIHADDTAALDEQVWVPASDLDPRPPGWPAAPTSSPARSGWRSSPGTPTRSTTRSGSSPG